MDKNSQFLANEDSRTDRFSHNEKLNNLLEELRDLLAPLQEHVNERFEVPRWPIGLILSPPRSGSTLFLQFLASTGSFSYPTNLLTRFAFAPYFGALVQKIFFDPDCDYHGDFGDLQERLSFKSDLGKSKGALATNEFFHFWRNYFPNFDPDWLSDEQLSEVRVEECCRTLASVESLFGMPFVAKGWMFQYNLDYFFNKISPLVFFRIRRQPLYVMQSILWAREQFYGNRNLWLSMKPKEYERLKEMDVYHQVAGQVYFTERAIDWGLRMVPQANQLSFEYESFCADPSEVYRKIVDAYSSLGCSLPVEYKGPKIFECYNQIRLPEKDVTGLLLAYDDYVSGRIQL